jgi:hypothetical protein
MGGRAADLPPLPSFDTGVAGGSAQRKHDQSAERRERRFRARFPLIGGVLYRALPEPQVDRAWSSGAFGEGVVGRRLDALSDRGVIALHDRRIPRSISNIDHIAIGPTGLYVIDTKRYQGARIKKAQLGSIFSPGPPQLIVHGRNCTNLVSATARQRDVVAVALRGLPEAQDVPIVRMLVFVDSDWSLFTSAFEVDGVWIGPPKQMARVVSQRGPLDSETIRTIAGQLANSLKPA